MKKAAPAAIAVMAIALAAPVHADPDTDFDAQLKSYGIYGPRDFNAWMGKIVCERLHKGVDATADKSAAFLLNNLPRGTTTAQSWQFLGAAINTYCPDEAPAWQSAAEQHG